LRCISWWSSLWDACSWWSSLWDACSWWSSTFQTDAITDAQPTDHGTEDINEENTAGYFLYGPVDYSSDARNCSAVLMTLPL